MILATAAAELRHTLGDGIEELLYLHPTRPPTGKTIAGAWTTLSMV
jgi:hypothetical protein